MSDTRVTTFLDREREFDLLPRVAELEREVGAGIGLITKRVIAGDFYSTDAATIVRLALIGAGENPKAAADLARDYVADRPLVEGHALASLIVMAAFHGVKPPAAPAPDAAPPELILDATGPNPMRVLPDGSQEPVRAA